MARFTLPRDIYHGKGSLEVLKTLKAKKAIVVVGGGSMKRFGFLDKVESYLKEAGMEVVLFEGVEPDPSVETVMKGAEMMRDFEPDLIVAMGGGSPIDAAKAMWIFYEYPEFTFEEAVVPFGLPELRQKAKFVAIPSTSGTATEVIAFSVITDYKPKLVAHTGMDALTHAIEAYTASLRSNFTDPLALKAISMINENLIESYKENKECRELMHEAQCLAGMAFSNALLGIVHSMAHKVGAVFHIPHGCANAIFLPYVIQYNRKACEDRYADIAEVLGVKGKDNKESTDLLINKIREFNKKLSIPASMKEYGITEDEFTSNVKFIAHNAVLDACTSSNPRTIDDKTMEKLLVCTYYGNDVEL